MLDPSDVDCVLSLALSGESCRRWDTQGLRSDLGCSRRQEADLSGGSLGARGSVTTCSGCPVHVTAVFVPCEEMADDFLTVKYKTFPAGSVCPRCPGLERRAAVVGESGPSDPAAGRQNPSLC